MKTFFKNAPKVSFTSLLATIIIFLAFVGFLNFASSDARIIHVIGKILIPIMLIILMLNPVVGFIYSFYMKGKMKIVMILLHLICICTVSFFAFIGLMFRYFVPFSP
ncbi:hypothetical protein [Sporosarcina sp. YIM B06819]|uniref:hypothetical protein n=1 Tax=Sporosarcina sp. YIM B06819 TaxID=3081769 RepID=UPI00298CFABE|nr:hypothetical protein [Sporosarcina sp. YIM B06819]